MLYSRLPCLVGALIVLAPEGSPEPVEPAPGSANGRQLFEMHCAPCHGPRGEGGRGPTLAQPTLPRASDRDSLLRIIKGGISGTEMPPARLESAEIAALAAFVQSLNQLSLEPVPGDPAHGAELYESKGGCAQCHAIRGRGGAIGPDLTLIGLRRGAAYLRRALTDPGADVPQSYSAQGNFLLVRVVTHEGRAVSGVRINEDTFSIQLRDLSGRVHSFYKSELAELYKDWGRSPMPSYAAVFTPEEMDDMIAFLASLGADAARIRGLVR